MNKLLLAAACTLPLLIAGCHDDDEGGDFSYGTPAPELAEGLWNGVASLSGDVTPNTRRFHALITPDSTFWGIYTSGAGAIAGGLQGAGTASESSGIYTAPALAQLLDSGPVTSALTALFVTRSKFSGSVIASVGGSPQTLLLNPANSVTYDMAYEDQDPTLPPVPTAYTGEAMTAVGVLGTVVTLDPTAPAGGDVLIGQIASPDPALSPCFFRSPATAPTDTGNYFKLSLTFLGGGTCTLLGLTTTIPGVLFKNDDDKYVLVAKDSKIAFLEN